MNKNEIRLEAYRRMGLIEERYADYHVPPEVMAYYCLLKLIYTASFEAYL